MYLNQHCMRGACSRVLRSYSCSNANIDNVYVTTQCLGKG